MTRLGETLGYAPDKVEKNTKQFSDGNLAVVVVAAPVDNEKVPHIEQIYSAGAVCLSLLNAALASGWGANWLSGWVSHDRTFCEAELGLAGHEQIAGIIHIGTETSAPPRTPPSPMSMQSPIGSAPDVRRFAKAVAQMTDPRFRAVLGKGIGLTLGLLVAIYIAFVWVLGLFLPDTITLPWIGEIGLGVALSVGSFFVMIALSVFLMVPVASAFTGLFLDEVAEAVEDRHYPALPTAPRQSLSDTVLDSLGVSGRFNRRQRGGACALPVAEHRRTVDLLGAQRLFVGARVFSDDRHAPLGS